MSKRKVQPSPAPEGQLVTVTRALAALPEASRPHVELSSTVEPDGTKVYSARVLLGTSQLSALTVRWRGKVTP